MIKRAFRTLTNLVIHVGPPLLVAAAALICISAGAHAAVTSTTGTVERSKPCFVHGLEEPLLALGSTTPSESSASSWLSNLILAGACAFVP